MESPIFLADFVAHRKTWTQDPEAGPGTLGWDPKLET